MSERIINSSEASEQRSRVGQFLARVLENFREVLDINTHSSLEDVGDQPNNVVEISVARKRRARPLRPQLDPHVELRTLRVDGDVGGQTSVYHGSTAGISKVVKIGQNYQKGLAPDSGLDSA